MNKFIRFFLSLQPRQVTIADPAEKLLYGMTVTSKCRYNASIRIKRLSQFSFYTTTILSLGLIFIPLVESADVQLAYPSRVLNMLQIFLAVAVLVYSVINATARYETRAERLNECGDKIKELIRELRVDISNNRTNQTPIDLQSYNRRYTDISTDAENHTRADYSLAVIRTPQYYAVTGIPWLWEYLKSYTLNAAPYLFPASMIVLEVVCILDMIGITHCLTPFLRPALH
jgi:SMODS and SLOG-associating 2TM effector domain family 5